MDIYSNEDKVLPGYAVKAPSPVRVISVTSGKGGVGKTNSVVNIAVALSRLGKRVMLFDANLELGNIDVLFGLRSRYDIGHVIKGERCIKEALIKGPDNIMILPASSGNHELADLKTHERLSIIDQFDALADDFDLMLIDTGAGISSNVLFFNVASQDIVVVVTPEPAAITDAYALMKVLSSRHGERVFRLLVNNVRSRMEGLDVYRNMTQAADKFLQVSIDYLGSVLHDEHVVRSVIAQKAVTKAYPESKASRCFAEIASTICALPEPVALKGGMQFFWRRAISH